jgi:DNA repair photolyase
MSTPRRHRSPIKGRGALSQPPGRFESEAVEAIEDGWSEPEDPLESRATSCEPERARSIITTNDSPDIPFDQSINPYRGCEHGCCYCFSRPSHSYVGLSPGLDFETRLLYKADAARLLENELARPRYVCKPITLGSNTDPYQPVERRLEVTRSLLQVFVRHRHPVSLITKGALIERDLDLLADLARDRLASVMLSLPTLDETLKRTLEPRAASPRARLRVMRALRDAGIPVGVLVAPVIPAVTDHELEGILEACQAAGASRAGYVLLRLPYEVKDLFREWLAAHLPDRAAHVMSLIHQQRGERDNDPAFGTRMRGTGPLAALLERRFALACRRLGLETGRSLVLDTSRFRPPRPASPQAELPF